MNSQGSNVARASRRPGEHDLSITFTVDQSPQEVFDAINDVRGWWTGEIDGRTDALGAEFTYRYKDLHRTTQKIVESVPGRRVVWHVTASHIDFVADKAEWDGTDVVFEIAKKAGKTEVKFTHVGLAPEVECFDRCSSAWGYYIKESLRKRITGGKVQGSEKGRQ